MRMVHAVVRTIALCSSALALTYDEEAALLNVQWSGAAYCCGTLGNGCAKWNCPSCNDNVATLVVSNATTNANGFVGYDEDRASIIVAFSGTDPLSIRNWIDDISTTKTDFNGYGNSAAANCSGCQVHKGFFRAYQSVRAQVQAAVLGFRAQHPNATLACTGHSLGAALAQHAALDLSLSLSLHVDTLYNFGQPRTGNSAFSDFFGGLLGGRTFRVTHHKDPVPHLPFEGWGFHHEPLEVFYNERNTAFDICDGSGEDAACSDQYTVDLDVPDHLSYMNFDFTANYLICKL